jgi:hypothetical protein
MRRVIIAIVAICQARPALGDDSVVNVWDRAGEAVVIGELLIPDVRVELGVDKGRWVLSWPLVFYSKRLYRSGSFGLRLNPFVEPQFEFGRDAVRGLAGARLAMLSDPDQLKALPLIEGGALTGTDGNGGFAGVGLAFLSDAPSGGSFSVVARVVQTTQERRYDLALDLQLPFGAD